MNKGTVFIISGPSGSGKDTILKEVLKKRTDIYFSISSITRDMREGEVEGEKYHFISRKEFEEGLANEAFLEYNKYLENYYGTPKAPIDENLALGNDVLIECDVNGAAKIREKMPEVVSVFIMPPLRAGIAYIPYTIPHTPNTINNTRFIYTLISTLLSLLSYLYSSPFSMSPQCVHLFSFWRSRCILSCSLSPRFCHLPASSNACVHRHANAHTPCRH